MSWGGKAVLSILQNLDEKLPADINLVSHGDALSKIYEASCYFTAPGLGSIYESFLYKTPTFFLPPTNLTQHLQLKGIVDELIYPWRPSSDFDYLIGDEENYISSLYDFYSSNKNNISSEFINSIQLFITSPESKKTAVVNTGFEFAKKMGGASEKQIKNLISRYLNE